MSKNKGKANYNNDVDDVDDFENKDSKRGGSKFFIFLQLVIFPFAIIGSYFLTRQILKEDFSKCDLFVKYIQPYNPKTWNFEDKVYMIVLAWIDPAILVFVMVVMVMSIRLLFLVDPLRKTQPTLINAINGAIQNTLEQTFIFIPMFAYWVLKISNEQNKNLAIAYIMAFVISRVLYLIGYFFQAMGIFFVRGGAFAMTLQVQILLISAVLLNQDNSSFYSTFLDKYIK